MLNKAKILFKIPLSIQISQLLLELKPMFLSMANFNLTLFESSIIEIHF